MGFEQTFRNGIQNQPQSSLIYKFSQTINYIEDGKYCCFVEGKTDPKFYSNLKNKVFSNISNYLFAKYLENSEELLGKSAVIQSYNYIATKVSNKLDKCIFIVDHDYSGLDNYKVVNKNAISITKPYAFENYFLEDRNVKLIFDYYNISYDYDNFSNLVDKFVADIDDYNRLKSATTAYTNTNINNSLVVIPNIYKDQLRDIFYFDFKKDPYFYIDRMNREVENMKKYVKNSVGANNYYKYTSINFSNKREWIKGHIIFDFLRVYLKQIHNINIFKNYNEIVNNMDVDIIIKDGNGKKIS